MKGKLITIKASGEILSTDITKPPKLEEYQQIVGGYIEVVPYFDRYEDGGCVAFCNEEGKLEGLPLNATATKLWIDLLGYDPGDVLTGDIVVITGDQELLVEV